jgi:hypothetical protein
MSTQEAKDRLELLEGTLDLLIRRTLIFGSRHGQGAARNPTNVRRRTAGGTRSALSRPPAAGGTVGSPPNGELPRITGRRRFIP